MTEPQLKPSPPRIRVLYTADQIAARVREMGIEVARSVPDRPLFVGVLKGALMFHCDLARATPRDVELDFMTVSSYGAGKSSSGTVQVLADLRRSVEGRHVVLCEGVVDSGLSVSFLLSLLKSRAPASIQVATLLDKAPCRKMPVPLHHVGFTIGDEFVVGYGLDAAEHYRNLPYVGVLEEA